MTMYKSKATLAEVCHRLGKVSKDAAKVSGRLSEQESAEFIGDIYHHLTAIEYAVSVYGKIAKK